MEIKFKTAGAEESKVVNYEFPETLEALTEKFGESAVLEAATANFIISIQALARRHFDKSDAEIQTLVDEWNPNERASAVKQTPFQKAQSQLGKLSDEERAELLRRLQSGE